MDEKDVILSAEAETELSNGKGEDEEEEQQYGIHKFIISIIYKNIT